MVFGSLLKFQDEVLRDISAIGGFFFTTLVVLFAFMTGEVELFYQLTLGLFLVYIVNIGIRQFYFKDRPRKETHAGWIQKIYASTFPSMHAMRVWFIATVLAFFFSDPLMTALFAVLVGAVSYSRVILEKHYMSDVIVGSVLGVLIGVGAVYFI